MKQLITIIFLSFIICNISYSQKVGLVLSGGGAKGLAHIGVIRVLEENGIPIDYITGTSAGAIVGALYAAGYSPDEMEDLFRSEDFHFWSTGQIMEEYRYFFKKEEEAPDWLDLKFEMANEKLKILPPSYIIPQEPMDFAFMQLLATTNAVCNFNFDSLMVPFRCIASDVNENRAVELGSGDLGDAVRASMTVPFYFKPISINGTVLFDGGIYNNFPTDVMKEVFKPDFIIGHKVADESRLNPEDLKNQIFKLIMRPTDYSIEPEDGILLETRFTNVGLLDFKRVDLIQSKGTQTAFAMIDSIKSRISRRVDKKEITRKRNEFNSRKPELLFKNVQVEGVTDDMQRKFIIQSIKHKQDVVTLDEFRKEYFKLVADEQIRSMRPIAYYNENTGYFDIHLKVEPEKKLKVKFGGNVSTKPINQGYFNVDYRFFQKRSYTLSSNIYFGRFYSSFKFGGRIDFPTKTPFYIAAYSTLNRWDFFSSSGELFFEDVRPPYIIQDENNFRIEAGLPLGVRNKLSAGFSLADSDDEYYQIKKFAKDDTPDRTSFNGSAWHIEFQSNSLNYKQYATEGIFQNLSFKYIQGKEKNYPGSTSANMVESSDKHNYYLAQAIQEKYYRITKYFTLGTRIEGVYSNKKPFSNFTSTLLAAPGFYPTPHSKSMFNENFHANKYVAGGIKTIFKISDQVHFRTEGYVFAPVYRMIPTESLTVKIGEKSFDKIFFQGMCALVYQTGVGPLSLAANYYEKVDNKFYLTLNFGYILFNKRGF
ncbi:MAG: patatin-like phospholipase family protein [Prolixibacteraceae bacterium]|nr:patatin-like phospholipase family protein [Prolixibacteraceae bacterium]